MPTRINIDGAIAPPEDSRISVLDHGFLFGDSVYETLRTYGRKPFLFSKHFARLARSAASVALSLPWDASRTRAEMLRTLEAQEEKRDERNDEKTESRIRVVVTRGVGDIGPDPESCLSPTVVIIASTLAELPPEIYTQGVRVIISSFDRHRQFADVKSGNLLRQVLAFRESNSAGAFEAILLTPDGKLSDGITSNIYLIKKARLLTPGREAGIVEGITRGVVLELADRTGLGVVEGLFDVHEIDDAEEMFLTSTTREIVPIVQVNARPVGNGKPGAITLRLLDEYRTAIYRLVNDD